MRNGISKAELGQLMKLLHGELPEAEEGRLRRRLEREPEMEATFHQFQEIWEDLQLPPGSVAAGLQADVFARLEAAQPGGTEFSWGLLPSWARVVAAAALVTGAALGYSLSAWVAPGETFGMISAEADTSLTDLYWQALEESTPFEAEDEVGP
ncbi:MAG: hypothetical protein K0U98_19890 [Deltaproteobacteria bacterium]|nr:hypothetical protein [Deltaproteobacteria bacterium]